MHVPDGFINAPTSLAAGAIAAVGVGFALRGARRELDERTAPLAGLVATFVFAAQMINFPVAGGTSGHLLGGVLAAVLVGPATAVLCITTVLLVQAFVFADGGLSALGVNIVNMAFVGTLLGYGIFLLLRRILPKSRLGFLTATAVGSFASVPLAAASFVAFYAIGGTAELPLRTVLAAVVGIHLLIGLGEAAITTALVGSVLRTRPDLVRGAAYLRKTLTLPMQPGVPATQTPGRAADA